MENDMGILDNNLQKVQFKEKKNTAVTVSVVGNTRIDCRTFNTMHLSILAETVNQDIEVLGVFATGDTTKYTFALTPVDKSAQPAGRREITKAFMNSWQQYVLDVSAYRDWETPNTDRKSTRLNSSHSAKSRMPSSA